MTIAQDQARVEAGGLAPLDQACRDYDRMADALAYLGDRWRAHPDHAQAAAAVGLSPSHFHKIFTRWVGVSPKRYAGAIAQSAARGALADGASVEEAAWTAGYSGPSRLYDAFIAFEAATPGEARRRGAGVSFVWGAAPTPFGRGVFLIHDRGLSAIAFADGDNLDPAFENLKARFPAARYRRDDAAAADWAQRAFLSGEPTPLALFGTPWRLQVWRALIGLPPGETTTYRALAEQVCTARAARAVGAAVGANPVSWLIPCHRVLASDGRLTGYHWGVARKRAMLAFEAAHADI